MFQSFDQRCDKDVILHSAPALKAFQRSAASKFVGGVLRFALWSYWKGHALRCCNESSSRVGCFPSPQGQRGPFSAVSNSIQLTFCIFLPVASGRHCKQGHGFHCSTACHRARDRGRLRMVRRQWQWWPCFGNLLQGMAMEEKRQWCAEHGKRLHDEDGRVCCGRRSWRVSKFT